MSNGKEVSTMYPVPDVVNIINIINIRLLGPFGLVSFHTEKKV